MATVFFFEDLDFLNKIQSEHNTGDKTMNVSYNDHREINTAVSNSTGVAVTPDPRFAPMSKSDALKIMCALVSAEAVLMGNRTTCPEYIFENIGEAIEILELEILR